MELWSGKPVDYSNLRVFRALAFAYIKQDKLGARAIRCAYIGYPPGIKGYKLWRMEPGEPKCIINISVIFDETKMAMQVKDQQQAINQGKNLDIIEVEVELPTQSVQVKGTDNDQKPEPVANDYNLARDRVRRNIVPLRRYGKVDLIYFSLTVTKEI